MTTTETKIVPVEFWGRHADEGVKAELEVERDENEPGKVAISTYVDGAGSMTSYYLDREAAIVLARNVLDAVALR